MYGLAVTTMTGGVVTVDEQRHAVERMPYAQYYGSSYYERWLFAFETLLTEKEIISKEELERKVAEQGPGNFKAHPSTPVHDSVLATDVKRVLRDGASNNLEPDQAPKFRAEDIVMTKNLHSKTHLRLPSYAKGKVGAIERHYGAFGHPGVRAHGGGNKPAHLYSVRFEACEIWVRTPRIRGDSVYLDLFESYLEPVRKD